jgi:2'-5' RNA ligase
MIPAHGLDDVAAAVADPNETRPYRGHLTLARARERGNKIPSSLVGTPISGEWTATSVSLVRSRLGGGPARYEDIRTVDLQGA